MTTFPLSDCFGSFREIGGDLHLFTHCNPQGRGFLTYTCMAWVFERRVGVTLDSDHIPFSDEDMITIKREYLIHTGQREREAVQMELFA